MVWSTRPSNGDAPGQVRLGADEQAAYDQIEFLTSPPIAEITRNAAFSIGNGGTGFAIDLDTAEIDTYGWWDSTVPSRITPQIAGYYLVQGLVGFAANATGVRAVWIAKNGTDVNSTQQKVNTVTGGVVTALASKRKVILFNGSTDYVQLMAFQNSGGALNTSTEPNNYPGLSLEWRGAQ